jgi:GNAT superfamily N-acetyltransferase
MLVFGEPSNADAAASVTARPTVELSKVYVLPGLHGTGVSTAIMEATIEAARERGVASIWLGVNQRNERANRFYERSGFAAVGTKQFLVGAEVHDDFVRELVF